MKGGSFNVYFFFWSSMEVSLDPTSVYALKVGQKENENCIDELTCLTMPKGPITTTPSMTATIPEFILNLSYETLKCKKWLIPL